MYKKALLTTIAASLIVSQMAFAYPPAGPPPGYRPPESGPMMQPPPPPPPPPPRMHAPPPRREAYKPPPPPRGYNRYRFSNSWRSPHGQFRPGYAMPSYYYRDSNRYLVNDWRRYNLYEPPRDHQWLLVDGNFVLAAVGTGIIAHILLGH